MRHHQAIIQYPDRFESEFPSVFDGHWVNLETDGFHYHGFLMRSKAEFRLWPFQKRTASGQTLSFHCFDEITFHPQNVICLVI